MSTLPQWNQGIQLTLWNQGIQLSGQDLKEIGMRRASLPKRREILEGQVSFLEVLLRSPEEIATLDQATSLEMRTNKFPDGGKWRGAITNGLTRQGLIRPWGVTRSIRPSRHAGLNWVWQLADRIKAKQYLNAAKARLDHWQGEDHRNER